MAVYGISRDSPYTHIAWAQVLELTFPLLSDWNGEATSGFGLVRTYRGFEGIPLRSTFLVGTDATVRGVWSYGDAEVPDVDALLSAVRRSPA